MDLNIFEELKYRANFSEIGKPVFIGAVAVLFIIAILVGWNLTSFATETDFVISNEPSQSDGVLSESAKTPASVFVYVTGAVINPGLYELTDGARVAEAINAAGGFLDTAATDSVNLARTISDGEQISVADKSAQVSPNENSEPSIPKVSESTNSSFGLVNINTASASELVSLPGIGEATAAKIVADRQANGSFKTIDDLKRVSGIGSKKFESLSELICV